MEGLGAPKPLDAGREPSSKDDKALTFLELCAQAIEERRGVRERSVRVVHDERASLASEDECGGIDGPLRVARLIGRGGCVGEACLQEGGVQASGEERGVDAIRVEPHVDADDAPCVHKLLSEDALAVATSGLDDDQLMIHTSPDEPLPWDMMRRQAHAYPPRFSRSRAPRHYPSSDTLPLLAIDRRSPVLPAVESSTDPAVGHRSQDPGLRCLDLRVSRQDPSGSGRTAAFRRATL